MSHPTDEVLTLHAAGALEQAAQAELALHLDGCGDCRGRLEEISTFLFSKTVAAPISSQGSSRDTRPDGPTARAEASPVDLKQGSSLGRYVLLERLGAGGMGEVFAAYDPQLDRKIALKLLRSGTLSATEGRARLLREAQAMARLSHPNVVTVHDVGTFEDRVFIAMEFIEGETLGQWMRGNHGWRETVRMFLQAGGGLSAAHLAGIVHRDFKPDNILIGQDGRPRVLDFGLARQASSSGTEGKKPPAETAADSPLGSPLTRDGAVMGTPGYMAPEQLAGLPTDARSDQFSFCVAFYEGLYGKRPFGGATLKAHANEIVANRLPPAPAGHAAPTWVYEALKRGLQADPAARWPDMAALLSAMKPKRVARTSRLLGAVVALAVIASAGIAFSVWSTQRLRVCGGAERKLAGVWDAPSKGRLRTAFSETGAPFAGDAFRGVESALDAYAQSWISAEKDSCEAVRIRKTDSEELYERKTVCLESRLKQLKALVNLLETADREVVSNSVAAARGLDRIDDCRDAVALSLHGAPKEAKEREREEQLKLRVFEAKALLDAGKYARGVDVAKSAVIGGGSPAGLAEAYLMLGRLQTRAGDTEGAERSFFEAATSAETAGDAALAARAFSRLYAVVGGIHARFDSAHQWERLAAAAAARVGNDPDVEAELASNAGDVALTEGRPKDAKKEFERALRIRESTLAEGHPDLAMTLNNLGTAQAQLKQYDEAALSYERSLELHIQYEGTEHPNTASSMNNLAVVRRKQNRLSEALTLFERALAIRASTLGPDHLDVASSHVSLSHVLERFDKPADALEHLKLALAIREKALGAEHAQVGAVHADICDLYIEQRAFAEALTEAQRALGIYEATLGSNHPSTSMARERVGLSFLGLGQWEKANTELTKALEARKERSPDGIDVARSYNALGDLQLAQNHPDRALGLYEKALAVREAAAGSASVSVSIDLLGIGRCQLLLKQHDKAVAVLERAVALREKDDAPELAAAQYELARALWDSGPDGRARARTLAAQAREALKGPAATEVEKWLAAREKK